MNKNITVITVTFNNEIGLQKTLSSLAGLTEKPIEVIVIDGVSKDNTKCVVNDYSTVLNIRFISEVDDGIYDAMNKGLRMVKTKLVHYLNGGDEVYGEPYLNLIEPSLLPAMICDISKKNQWKDTIKLLGFGYCHQGIIFSSNHREYDTRYIYASDLDLIVSVFPNGLHNLKMSNSGSIVYYLGGFSSINNDKGDLEIIQIFKRQFSIFRFLLIYIYINSKSFLPRILRRSIRSVFP
jgi:glycosyltransferase involved in cell wall biosynthesis